MKKNLRLKNKDDEEILRMPKAKTNRNTKQNNMVLGMTLGGNLVEDDFEFTDDESMTSEEGSQNNSDNGS